MICYYSHILWKKFIFRFWFSQTKYGKDENVFIYIKKNENQIKTENPSSVLDPTQTGPNDPIYLCRNLISLLCLTYLQSCIKIGGTVQKLSRQTQTCKSAKLSIWFKTLNVRSKKKISAVPLYTYLLILFCFVFNYCRYLTNYKN